MKTNTKALAYLRTSSATNVGGDKDSEKRQRTAIASFAKRAGYELVAEFNDQAVSGKDPIEGRPGFKALLERIVSNGARVVIVEDASRFARHLMTQEAGIALLVELGVRVLTANGDDLTDSDDEFRVAMRQIMGVFSQLERARTVKKLKAARDRKRAETGRCEGRLMISDKHPQALEIARKLRGSARGTRGAMSYRALALALADRGIHAADGKPYTASAVRLLLVRG